MINRRTAPLTRRYAAEQSHLVRRRVSIASVETTRREASVRKLALGDVLVAAGGALVFLASFLPFVTYDAQYRGPFERSHYDTWFNAWQSETFMAPLTAFVALAGAAAAVIAVVRTATGTQRRFLTFSLPQLETMLGLFATLSLLGYATSNKSIYFGSEWADSIVEGYADGLSFAAGGYLMLIGAAVCFLGGVLTLYNVGPGFELASGASMGVGQSTASPLVAKLDEDASQQTNAQVTHPAQPSDSPR